MAKKVTVPFLEPDELRAACAYMGASNMAYDNDRLMRLVKENLGNFKRMASSIEHALGNWAESDEMFTGMLKECDWFRKDFNSKNVKDRAYWLAEWKKVLDKAAK